MEPPHKRANTDKERCYRMSPVRDSSYQDHQCITDIHVFKSKLTLFDHHCITKWPIRTMIWRKKFRLGNILLQKGNQKDLGLIGFFLCVFYNYMQESGGEMQPSLKEFIFTQSVCFSKLSVSCGKHNNWRCTVNVMHNKRWNFVFQIVKKMSSVVQ